MSDLPSEPTLTRRTFINLAGRAGGASAVYSTMAAMGLLATPTAYAGPPGADVASSSLAPALPA
jgi:hypothetical protein